MKIEIEKVKKFLVSIRIIIVGIIIILIYWVLQISIENYIFGLDSEFYYEQVTDGQSIAERLLPYRIFMRISVSIPILIFSTYAQIIINQRQMINDKLQQLDNFKTDLIRRTSHELKTPLNSIFSTSQYIINNYQNLDKELINLISVINRGGLRLTGLTQNLLDAFNLEVHELKLAIQEHDIVEVINQCVNDLKILLLERNIYIKKKVLGTLLLDIDRTRIEQVLLNLLSNAIKNTPPKGIIFIDLKENKNYIEIIIKDTGIGITQDEEKKLFQKFGKIERSGVKMNIVTEGSGLGLYISKEIIELHRGEIRVKSEGRNKGSTFIIKLPKP